LQIQSGRRGRKKFFIAIFGVRLSIRTASFSAAVSGGAFSPRKYGDLAEMVLRPTRFKTVVVS
jgi:hypothetical protein